MEQKGNISRRDFLQRTGLSVSALAIGCVWPVSSKSAAEIIRVNNLENAGTELMAWISIDESGGITIFNHRSEMGQGTWQTIPQIIAEELEVSMDQVTIQSAGANPQK